MKKRAARGLNLAIAPRWVCATRRYAPRRGAAVGKVVPGGSSKCRAFSCVAYLHQLKILEPRESEAPPPIGKRGRPPQARGAPAYRRAMQSGGVSRRNIVI